MTNKEKLIMAKAEVESLKMLRENFRSKELMFKDVCEQKSEEDKNTFACRMDSPEYKLEQLYHRLGEQMASKLDSLITVINEYDK